MMNFYILLLPIFSNFGFISCKDTFRFASHYADHMVLQRDPNAAVLWGFGEENAQVTVSIGGKLIQATAEKDWRGLDVWLVQLNFPAGGPYKITATSIVGNQLVSISLEDVYFGDVWLCGGQSNMVFTTNMSLQGEEEIDHASVYQKIRLFTVARYASEKPVPEFEEESILQQWAVASKESVGGKDWSYFSALCWMFGRRLYEQYGTPIGLISSNYGGTRVEAWSSPETNSKCNGSLNEFNPTPSRDDYFKNIQSGINPNENSVLWNAMVYPLLNTTIYGVIWYQGEANAMYRTDVYNCTFPAMINDWRKEWFSGTYGATNLTFPFGFVQLAPVCFDVEDFPSIRWKQTAEYGYVPNLKQPDVFMAVAMDLPDPNSPYQCIHPRDKTDVAERLALGARAVAYGEKVDWTGPIMDSTSIQDSKITITVKSGQQIEVRSLEGFEVEYSNGTWTSVSIMQWTSTEVTLSVKSVEDVRRVRYAWKNTPCKFKKCAIYGKGTNLPSGPFILSLL